MQAGKFPKINKRAGWNKAVQVGIFQKINKLCSTFIRETRVCRNINCWKRNIYVLPRIFKAAGCLLDFPTQSLIQNKTGFTGQVFSKRIEITPQIYIRIFEEHMAWGQQVHCWGSFLTCIGSSGLMRTLWMSEMTPFRVPVLKPFFL